MRIIQVDAHRFVKELDPTDVKYYANIDDILKHINNQAPYDSNPHNVTAEMITRDNSSTPWDLSLNLQGHTEDADIHLNWDEYTEVYNAGNVTPGRLLTLANTKDIQRIWIFVDGRKMIQGTDFLMTSWLPNAIVRFLDPAFPVGNTNVNIEVEYRQNRV